MYLMAGTARSLADIRDGGVDCDSLLSGFRKDDWVLLSSHDPSAMTEFSSLSLGSETVLRIDGQTLLRREYAEGIVQQIDRLELIPLPNFEVPIKFVMPSPSRFIASQSELLDSVAAMVSEDSLESYVRRLEAFVTRYTPSDSVVAARDWLVSKFRSYGCEAVVDSFLYLPALYGDYAYNVVADHTGTSAPETYIIICGHFDSTVQSGNPLVLAPGADDNASGTAMCLEIARVLSGFDTPKTVRFICFSGEEQGLLGSYAYVNDNRNLNIEIVLNADMIAYNTGTNRIVNMYCKDDGRAHAELIGQMVSTYGFLVPSYISSSGFWELSDHYPFHAAGFRALFASEHVFNTLHYHSTHDIADNCDFAYMTKIVKGCAAGVYAIAQAPPAVEGFEIADLGKGDRLLARWKAFVDPRDFDIVLRLGTFPGDSSFKFVLPKSDTTFPLTDLAEHVEYFVSATVTMGDSESIVRSEASGVPVAAPETPSAVHASPGYRAIDLTWSASPQIDVVGYKIMRSVRDLDQFKYIATVDSTQFADSSVDRSNYHDYYVVAVDEDSIESEPTAIVTSRGAFFDHNLLVILETGLGFIDASNAIPRYRYALANIEHTEYLMPATQDYFTIEELGQFRSLFWICDGNTALYNNIEALRWLRGWGGNIMIGGPMTVDPVSQYASDWFGLQSNDEAPDTSFLGAKGIDGWPDAVIDTSVKSEFNMQGLSAALRFVRVFEYDEIVSSSNYRYQSVDTLDNWNNLVCGLHSAIDTNQIVLLGYPIFHLELQSARSIMEYAADLFGVPRAVAGDVNEDARLTIVDVLQMIRILFLAEPMPADVNWLDVNADCEFNIIDVQFLISYMYLGGPDPSYGCAGN
jgi:hypothetical protein